MTTIPSPPVSTNSSATWLYHDRLRAITHGPNECEVCDSWIIHFALALAHRRSDLAEAEQQRDAADMGRLPADCADLRRALEGAHDALDGLRRKYDALCIMNANLRGENCGLRDQLDCADYTINCLRDAIARLRIDHSPRRRGTSMSSPRASSRGNSPMWEDPDERSPTPPAPAAAIAPVLSAALVPPLSASVLPSPFWPTVGFSSLLPVIFQGEDNYLHAADRSAPVDASGNFNDKARYVFAFGGFIDGQPSWRTSLVLGSFFTRPIAMKARQASTTLPITGVVLGGRNGMLVSDSGPTTEAVMENLLTTPEQRGYAAEFIDRIWFTPPELRNNLHNRALELWRASCQERQTTTDARRPEQAKPLPSARTSTNTPEAGPSSAAQLQHLDNLDDVDIELEGCDEALEGDDEPMGPT
ncbi:hypothetical protein BC826DRAFT_966965 [Russula brevipes]|nr:hypothetical protein BC826DRAFT_966965 [Russula brevipes]